MQKVLKIRNICIFAVFISIILFLIKAKIPDTDTFFLAATGRYIVENGVVPTVNPFVIHEGFEIIVQQWLFDVLIYFAYNSFGNLGLFAFVTTAFAVSMILLYKYFGLFTDNKFAKRTVLLLSAFIYVMYGVARPTSISFIVMTSLLFCIEQYRRTNKVKYLYILPLLSLLEINVHSAMWPMMFVLMVPYIFPYTLPTKANIKDNVIKWFRKNYYILTSIAIMAAVGFLNPNGIKGITYVLKSYNNATNGIAISELQAPPTNSIFGITVLVAVAFLAVYIYQNKEKLYDKSYDMQTEFTRFYMHCGVLILSCMHIRNLWYLLLGATPVILTVVDNCMCKLWKTKTKNRFIIVKSTLYVSITVILVYFMLSTSQYSVNTNTDSKYAPIAALEYLESLDEDSRNNVVLYTEFNNGAFMEWHDYKVYIDARPELFQKNINGKEDIYTEFCNVISGEIDYEAFLTKYDFSHLIVSDNTLFEMYLSLNSSYSAVVDGDGYMLYELIE